MDKPEHMKLGISACLLGQNVRYDGGNRLDTVIMDTLGGSVKWVPVCPEVECGLPVPRDVMRLEDAQGAYRLVAISTRLDHTDRLSTWAEMKLGELDREGLHGFIFKDRSPSCGLSGVAICFPDGRIAGQGTGIFASQFRKRFPLLPVEGEGRLHDPALMTLFIKRLSGTNPSP